MVATIKKSTDRRADIIDVACELFQTKGYDQTTIQDIMDVLDIAKGTVYHYFQSKEAIVEAVIEKIIETNISSMKIILEQSNGTALENMKLLISAGNVSDENKSIVQYLHQPGNEFLQARILAGVLVKQSVLYGKVIEQGCREGIFQTDTPLESAEFILFAVQFLTDYGIYPWTEKDITRRAQAFPKIIERQLKAPTESFQFLTEYIQRSLT